MTKLRDTQHILLSSASQREYGNLLPLPASLTKGPRIDKALPARPRSE